MVETLSREVGAGKLLAATKRDIWLRAVALTSPETSLSLSPRSLLSSLPHSLLPASYYKELPAQGKSLANSAPRIE